jgi:hypothetical protein
VPIKLAVTGENVPEHVHGHPADVAQVVKRGVWGKPLHTAVRCREKTGSIMIEVANLVAEATNGRPDVVIAALLHDVVED